MMKRYRNKYIIYLGSQTLPKGLYRLTKVYYDRDTITITIYLNDDKKSQSETIRMSGGTIEMLEAKLIKKKNLDNYLEYTI